MKYFFSTFHACKHYCLALLLFLAVSSVLYLRTVHSHFLFDWNSDRIRYMEYGWQGMKNCYHDKSMRWVTHLHNILIYEVMGMSPHGWHYYMLFLHSLNATLLFALLLYILKKLNISGAFRMAALAAVLWLVSPFHTETIVWAACTLHLIILTFVLTGLNLFVRYLVKPSRLHIAGIYAMFFLAMFTYENFIPFPFLLFVLFLLFRQSQLTSVTWKKYLTVYFVPMLLFTGLYFVANKFRIGQWVGRYGEAAHFNTDVFLIVPNLTKYLTKLLYVHLFFTYSVRDTFYEILHSPWAVYSALTLYVVLFSTLFYVFLKTNCRQTRLAIALFAMFCMAMIPIINLYLSYNKDIDGERYLYFPSGYFYGSLVLLSFQLRKGLRYGVILACLLCSVAFTWRNNTYWYHSGQYANSLLQDFRWPNAERVYVLLSPENYNGAVCMRNMPHSTLFEMLYVQRGIDLRHRIIEAYQWNPTSPYDSATHSVIDSNTLSLKVHTKGGWLWYQTFGAVDTSNEHFTAKMDRWYPWYTIRFHQKKPGDVIIYANNKRWVQIEDF
ncbi:MAG: hypothetical protein NZM35_07025 [Chitinophagales bacterium]|nr:hypothetical protein [Chitinophagales bacterium]MDW8419236.1 hypothetical protein [Chitinophagales bacterium]